MGIDVYVRWPGQTKAEEEAQYTGFSVVSGHVGYLREAYHGDPYATKTLMPEGFLSDDGEAHLSAATLRERLPETLQVAKRRALKVYGEYLADDAPELKAFEQFVDLYEKLEAEGKAPYIVVSY